MIVYLAEIYLSVLFSKPPAIFEDRVMRCRIFEMIDL